MARLIWTDPALADLEAIADYIALGLEILRDVGLPASGVTSPWTAGDRNELDYARAIGDAQWRVHQRAVTWYFLHTVGCGHGPPACTSSNL